MKRVALCLWVVFILAAVGLLVAGRSSKRSAPRAAHPPVAASMAVTASRLEVRSADSTPTTVTVKSAVAAVGPPNERSIMNELRQLGSKDPQLSLQLARRGNAQFPNTADAPEREWYAIRALVDSGDLTEAVAAARLFVEAFPNHPLAQDVARHLLTHPLTHPTEVGYGQ
ncbi:MAG: hypothetical protein K0R38_12 [Polyangiaceae bacterium]|jgi:hypothetical protein|nr:hypothetical protein [Polyangiaceae bacterium]